MKKSASYTTLATTSLQTFWGGSEPDAFLGRWCLLFPLDLERADLVNRVLSYPWNTSAARIAAYRYCVDLKRALLPNLADLLNAHHGTSYSLRSMNLMIGPWLLRLVMVSYHHYRCLEEAQRQLPGALVYGPKSGACPPPKTSIDFFFDLFHAYRHQEIFTHFAEKLGMACERVPPSLDDLPDGARQHTIQSRRTWNERAYRGIRRVPKYVTAFVARNARCVLYNATPTPRESLQLSLASCFRIAPLPMFALDQTNWTANDVGLRDALGRELRRRTECDSFSDGLVQLLFSLMPLSFLEYFNDLKRQVGLYFPPRPRQILSSMAWVGDDAFCLWAAESIEIGSELISAQHGGTYGVREMASGSEIAEADVTDKFLSWGKGTVVGPKPVALPVPPHFYLRSRRNGRGNLLFVEGLTALLPIGFMSAADGPDTIDIVERKRLFFAKLPETIRNQFLIRPYPNNFGWCESARLNTALPGLNFDDLSISFMDRLSKARLVVVDNMHSTYVQALGSGVPTILTWNSDYWTINSKAAPLFEKLKQASVFHDDPEAAAARVAEIADDPEAWWSSPQVVCAVGEFLENYFRVGPGWISAWRRELLS